MQKGSDWISIDRITAFAETSARLGDASRAQPFELIGLVTDAINASESERNGRIGVHVELPDDAIIEGSRERWLFLFTNLFRNTAQVRAGSGKVWVRREWATSGRLHIYVDDDGPGVPLENRERIFEQGISYRGGTGMGLFVARTTLQMCNGSILCEESPENGARFHLEFNARRTA